MSASLTYRTLVDEDLAKAAALLSQTNFGPSNAELEKDLRSSLSRWPGLQIAAFTDKSLAGLIAGRVDVADPLLGWSDDIVIAKPRRGLGIGAELMRRQLDAFRKLGCRRVRGLSPEQLYPAIAFFERFGFKVIDRTVAKGLWGIPDGAGLCITEVVL